MNTSSICWEDLEETSKYELDEIPHAEVKLETASNLLQETHEFIMQLAQVKEALLDLQH